jgi:NAD(P)-dependent dehydrogenase (short-subunit alcohol dehydrogenase family)
MDLHLAGLRALLTGGTRGIGRAVAETLLDEGACVSFCARGLDAVTATQAELGSAGKTVVGSAVDVADGAALAAWVTESAAALGGIDILVANASAMATADTEENWARWGSEEDRRKAQHFADRGVRVRRGSYEDRRYTCG